MDARHEMLALLDHRVFGPAINADPKRYPGDRQRELADVKKTAKETQESYHHYGSAEHIKSMFQDDLRSPYGKRQTDELHELGLPALSDVKDDFLDIAARYHIS